MLFKSKLNDLLPLLGHEFSLLVALSKGQSLAQIFSIEPTLLQRLRLAKLEEVGVSVEVNDVASLLDWIS